MKAAAAVVLLFWLSGAWSQGETEDVLAQPEETSGDLWYKFMHLKSILEEAGHTDGVKLRTLESLVDEQLFALRFSRKRVEELEKANSALITRLVACEEEAKTEPQLHKNQDVINKTVVTENAALTGKASQSSLWGHWGTGSPSNAIDGNQDGVWSHGSCAHTNYELNPWWRVDLLKTYTVSTVTISNRVDNHPNRLDGAEIRIGNSLDNHGINNPRCAVFNWTLGTVQTFQCNGMEGRYVTVVIPRRENLALCEVEVTGSALLTEKEVTTLREESSVTETDLQKNERNNTENVAISGKAFQSSVSWCGLPSNANDGNRNGEYAEGSCTHTEYDQSPWWRVDLLRPYRVSSVTISNRADRHHRRLHGAEIHIGDSLDNNGINNPRCGVFDWSLGAVQTFRCDDLVGRYVTVVIPGRREFLTLCEVEVYGTRVMMDGEKTTLREELSVTETDLQLHKNKPVNRENAALTGKATQSSLLYCGYPSNAIDGNRDQEWPHGSCTHTHEELSPWWTVDLLKTYNVSSVTISNRAAVSRRLDGAHILIGNSPYNNGINNPRCAVFFSRKGHLQTFQCNRMEGRYVTVVIPDRREVLTLCEVEVSVVDVKVD